MPIDSPRDALRFLRSHATGILIVDEAVSQRRFVLDPSSGLPVTATIDPGEFRLREYAPGVFVDAVFCVPDDGEDSVQMLGTLSPCTDSRADIIYRAIHFGAPDEGPLARLAVESLKWLGGAASCDEVFQPNPLMPRMSEIIKAVGADAPLNARAASRLAGQKLVRVSPLVVDPDGAWLWTEIGPIRLNFDSECSSVEGAIGEFLRRVTECST